MKPSYLWRGLPGHPVHSPLTDATLGIYTLATVAAILSVLGVAEEDTARAWWLALVIGLVFNAPTAATGIVDWLDISRGTPLKRTATAHMLVMQAATVLFALAAILGHGGYEDAEVPARGLLLTLIGFAVLSVGGWIGGTIVYVHGMRVLNLADEPAARATAPIPTREKEAAEGGEGPATDAAPGTSRSDS